MSIVFFTVMSHFDILLVYINYFRLIRLNIIIFVYITSVFGFIYASLQEKIS